MDDKKWGHIGNLRFLMSQDPAIDPKINCLNGKHSHVIITGIYGSQDICSECGIDMTHLMNYKIIPTKKRRMRIARKFKNKLPSPTNSFSKDLYDFRCKHGKDIVYRPPIFGSDEEKNKICYPCSWYWTQKTGG